MNGLRSIESKLEAPAEPEYTCPCIDSHIETMRDHMKYLEEMFGPAGYLRTSDGKIEQIRKQNVELREWGQWWKDKCEELQERIEQLEEGAE